MALPIKVLALSASAPNLPESELIKKIPSDEASEHRYCISLCTRCASCKSQTVSFTCGECGCRILNVRKTPDAVIITVSSPFLGVRKITYQESDYGFFFNRLDTLQEEYSRRRKMWLSTSDCRVIRNDTKYSVWNTWSVRISFCRPLRVKEMKLVERFAELLKKSFSPPKVKTFRVGYLFPSYIPRSLEEKDEQDVPQ